ncbi:MAG: hypothetical protein IV100_30000, partial [Myxococcales bacterium]|nr:hypothetical protein [Myxococcales bacterium]
MKNTHSRFQLVTTWLVAAVVSMTIGCPLPDPAVEEDTAIQDTDGSVNDDITTRADVNGRSDGTTDATDGTTDATDGTTDAT